LTVHALLDQIRRYLKREGKFPRKLYLQFDGGAENANQTVLGWLQVLVAKRIVPEIILTRLPTGHTHDDIDALFGHIWRSYRLKPCLTLSQYKENIFMCFEGTSQIDVDMLDINIVANYEGFLQPFNDTISRWAKEDLTIHQFHIYSVEPDILYPLGYKLRFRDYCSNQVVELLKVPKIEALTPIGQLTGIEAVTHNVKWFPDEQNDMGIIGDGIYTLRTIPVTDPIEGIIPDDFDQKDIDKLLLTKSAILNCSSFPDGCPEREEWIDWFRSVLPEKGNLKGSHYIKNHNYEQPLNEYLSNTIQVSQPVPEILENFYKSAPSQSKATIEWPEDIYSYATPHVSFTGWKAQVINPRVYRYQTPGAQTLVKDFQDSTKCYYDLMDKIYLVPMLTNILRRRLNAQGRHEPVNGNKEALILRIAQGDLFMFTKIYGGIREEAKRKMIISHSNSQNSQSTLSNPIIYSLLNGFNQRLEDINEITFLKLLELFRHRDDLRCKTYDNVYSVKETTIVNSLYLRNIYFNPEIGAMMFALELFTSECKSMIQGLLSDSKIMRLFFPIRSMKSLIVVSVPDKEFWYYNADISTTKPIAEANCSNAFDIFKKNIIAENEKDDWKSIFHRNCIHWERCGDTAIIALIVHILNDMPIYFQSDHLNQFQEILKLSLIENKLQF
jgi:hypothetical protein